MSSEVPQNPQYPQHPEYPQYPAYPEYPQGDRQDVQAFTGPTAWPGTPGPTAWPGTPSAWEQPASGHPAPRGNRRWWWLAGAGVAVVAVVVGLIISNSGGGSGTNQNASTSTASPTASERIFTHIAAECSLIKTATLASIAPGATCTEAPTDAASASMKQPSWSNENSVTSANFISIQVTVNLSPDATGWFSMSKTAFLDVWGKNDTLHDSRTLTGLGDQEYVGYVTDKITPASGTAEVDVRWGNAVVTVEYNYDTEVSGQTETQQQAETAALAAARDILGGLS